MSEEDLQRNRERITVRGLNDNHNHDLKNLFKGAALGVVLSPDRCTIPAHTALYEQEKECGRRWPVSPWHERLPPSR